MQKVKLVVFELCSGLLLALFLAAQAAGATASATFAVG